MPALEMFVAQREALLSRSQTALVRQVRQGWFVRFGERRRRCWLLKVKDRGAR